MIVADSLSIPYDLHALTLYIHCPETCQAFVQATKNRSYSFLYRLTIMCKL